MAKNKGLTPKRKKIDRNPRVKHREKFRRAKIRRKGQVRTAAALPDRFDCRITSPRLRLLVFPSRCGRFVGRIKDTAESCLVFVLVLRRAPNSNEYLAVDSAGSFYHRHDEFLRPSRVLVVETH